MRAFAERVFSPALVLGFVALALVSVLLFPRLLVDWRLKSGQQLLPAERVKAENDVSTTLLQGVGGLVLVAGAIATWRQFRLNREGQVTERFTRAIDQLGSEKLEVRLGGIYALERIARDSARDHGPIMEVLTAYIRENAPAERMVPARVKKGEKSLKLATDIQAVLTVLGRRTPRRGEVPLNLAETNLQGANLGGLNLQGAILWDVNLQGAHLAETDLQGAILWDANLQGAQLDGVNLQGANLGGANLQGANLKGINLRGANVRGANLQDAYLTRLNLQGADLRGANLEGTISLTPGQFASARTDETTKLPG
jgi:Pentapeptide repeats (8 copies)